jgi:AAA domain
VDEDRRSPWEIDLDEGRARVDSEGNIIGVGDTTWRPIDLGPVLRGEKRPLEPEFLARDDGQPLIYRGAPHVFYGESETLKSWAAHLAAKSFLDEGLRVLYIDFESNDVTFVQGARQVGVSDGFIGTQYVYIRPDEPLYVTTRSGEMEPVADATFHLDAARYELKPALIIVDGVSEAYALHGWNINDATDAARFVKVFGRWDDDTASIAIDHAGKNAERGQIGSQHKRAGIDGAQYLFEAEQRQGRGGHSIARISVTKDRPGAVRAFAPDGRVARINVTDDRVWLEKWEAGMFASGDGGEALRRRVLAFVGGNPAVSQSKIEKGVKGDTNDIRNALDWSVTFQLIEREQVGQAKRHTLMDAGREYLAHVD